jgi:transposase InsO family protein
VAIDRFSHELSLTATKDVTAETAAQAFFEGWVCRAGPPKRITSDGGNAFIADKLKSICTILNIEHHISAPYHYEGHGAVERANRDIGQTVRAIFRKDPNWPRFVKAVEFALNTAFSRTLGTSPWAIIHGYPPRLPLHAALDTDPAVPAADDPLNLSAALATRFLAIADVVRNIQKDLYEKDLLAYARAQKGRYDFNIGDFVLVKFPR